MSYEPGRRCEMCGCESPRSPVCGACEVSERDAVQIEVAECERDAAIARAEAAEAELRAIREEVRADPAAKTVDAVAALLASARCTVEDQTNQTETLRMMLDATTDKLNEYIDKTVEAEKRARDAEREAERLRHGVPIESDMVCPNELRATEAEAELARLRPLAEAATDYVAAMVLISDPAETNRMSAELSKVAYKLFADEVRHG